MHIKSSNVLGDDALERNLKDNKATSDRIANIYFSSILLIFGLAFSAYYWKDRPVITPTKSATIAGLLLASVLSILFYQTVVAKIKDSPEGRWLSIFLPIWFLACTLSGAAFDSLAPLGLGVAAITLKSWQLHRVIRDIERINSSLRPKRETLSYFRQLSLFWLLITVMVFAATVLDHVGFFPAGFPVGHTHAYKTASEELERIANLGLDTTVLQANVERLERSAVILSSLLTVVCATVVLFLVYRVVCLSARKIEQEEVLRDLRRVYSDEDRSGE